jgi:hypothetical protein
MSAVTPETVAETVANALGTKLAHYMGNTQAHAIKMAGVAIAPLVAERDELLAALQALLTLHAAHHNAIEHAHARKIIAKAAGK